MQAGKGAEEGDAEPLLLKGAVKLCPGHPSFSRHVHVLLVDFEDFVHGGKIHGNGLFPGGNIAAGIGHAAAAGHQRIAALRDQGRRPGEGLGVAGADDRRAGDARGVDVGGVELPFRPVSDDAIGAQDTGKA